MAWILYKNSQGGDSQQVTSCGDSIVDYLSGLPLRELPDAVQRAPDSEVGEYPFFAVYVHYHMARGTQRPRVLVRELEGRPPCLVDLSPWPPEGPDDYSLRTRIVLAQSEAEALGSVAAPDRLDELVMVTDAGTPETARILWISPFTEVLRPCHDLVAGHIQRRQSALRWPEAIGSQERELIEMFSDWARWD